MTTLNLDEVNEFVNSNIVRFHENRLKIVRQLSLNKLIHKNPYLFKAKNHNYAPQLIESFLSAFLSSSEEKIFGDFLEDLAIFVASKTCNGRKSTAQGIDLEFNRDSIHYIVSIKSGTNWGNSSQHKKLAEDFKTAKRVLQQSQFGTNVQPVLGICYGNTKTTITKDDYLKVVGQNFWYLISMNDCLYIDIIEPIGYQAKVHNEAFDESRDKLANRLIMEFVKEYCYPDGAVNWEKLVQHSCGNFDLNTFIK
ncbi:MAG: cytosolic protein [Anaerolineae bacterium]|jgi:hypothetical protein|nr:cytosolic protein [Anaerolineae bacterium]